MSHLIVAVIVALAYFALALVAGWVAYAPADAWTVWMSSGVVLGALLVLPRGRWLAVLGGGFVGATAFALTLGSGAIEAAGYGCIEVIACGVAAFVVSRVAALPLRLDRPRDLAALILAGAVPLALAGAALATAWHIASGGNDAATTFRVWALSNVIGTLLVAPLVVAWAGFRLQRSGGLPMPAFAGGAVACALFLGVLWLLFDAAPGHTLGGPAGAGMTYLPIVFLAVVALLWGARGATLAAFAGALIAMVNTAQGQGPFAGVEGFLGEAELEVEGYVLAMAMTALLIAVLVAGQRNAMRAARDWQTRFEAAIGAHRMLAYEWDPASGRMVVSGDSVQLLGVAPAKLATLADWLALVAPDERDAVRERFARRAEGAGAADPMTYRLATGGALPAEASDEARAIRDHDGALHRVVGIVRLASPGTAPAEAGGTP